MGVKDLAEAHSNISNLSELEVIIFLGASMKICIKQEYFFLFSGILGNKHFGPMGLF